MSQCPSCGGICKKSGCERVNPVGKFAKFTDGIWREVTDGSPGIFLYTAPPQREWVGLTDDEIWQEWSSPKDSAIDFARTIEAKLKEKNT